MLKEGITDRFYVGGKLPENGSVNGYFFALNARGAIWYYYCLNMTLLPLLFPGRITVYFNFILNTTNCIPA